MQNAENQQRVKCGRSAYFQLSLQAVDRKWSAGPPYHQWRRHGVVWGSCNYPTLKKSTHTICLNPRSFFRGGGGGGRVWRRKQGELSSLQHSIKIVLGDRLI